MLFGREEHAKLRIKINREILVCNNDLATVPLLFENFSLDALSSEQKPSERNGRRGRSETGRPAGQLA